MSRSWNSVVHELRYEDYLSDHERDELLFRVLSGPHIEAFFGVPEYIVFPTMLTSPVFDSKSWGTGLKSFTPALPSLYQTCDLVCWLIVTLGLTPERDRKQLLGVLHELAGLTHGAIQHDLPVVLQRSRGVFQGIPALL